MIEFIIYQVFIVMVIYCSHSYYKNVGRKFITILYFTTINARNAQIRRFPNRELGQSLIIRRKKEKNMEKILRLFGNKKPSKKFFKD